MVGVAAGKTSGDWVYPDPDGWEKLMLTRPRRRAAMEKPDWWHTPWPPRRIGQTKEALSPHRKFEALKHELAWAQRCLYYAQSVLPDSAAKHKVVLLAEALGRVNQAIDAVEKAQGIYGAADELRGISQYDPARYPRAFVENAGRSLVAAGKILGTSPLGAVAYWGRALVRAGGFVQCMKHDLPGGHGGQPELRPRGQVV